jgi:hypothetical protein
MLQKNTFFSSPLIFYGPHQDSEEIDEDVLFEEEWNFSESWIVTLNSNGQNTQSKIGLFIHWVDPESD